MDKIIIHHGERVTEHPLGDAPVVIGRDPDCDLFFADKKLSRRHARIERHGVGFRLVDLGSRNGCWVNEERVREHELSEGDEIRLGGLTLSLEHESEVDPDSSEFSEQPGDRSTLYLTSSAELPDTGTVVFRPQEGERSVEAAPPPPPEDSSTVFLPPGSAQEPDAGPNGDEGDETLKRPEPERTVAFGGEPSRSPYDTGTVLFRGTVDPNLPRPAAPAVRPARDSFAEAEHAEEAEEAEDAEQAEEAEQAEQAEQDRSEPAFTASVTYVPDLRAAPGRSWAARFVWLAAGLAFFAVLVLALPLLRILQATAAEQSELRARALVELLAAANETALREDPPGAVSIERVVGEPGVTGAYVITTGGEILAPRDRAGQRLEIEGLAPSFENVRSLQSAASADGDRVLLLPISHQGRRLGLAVLTHESSSALTGWAMMVILFGSLLLAIAFAVMVLLARRMTILPIEELRSEVEALEEGRAAAIVLQRPYSELSLLASSLNRLLASHRASGMDSDSSPRR